MEVSRVMCFALCTKKMTLWCGEGRTDHGVMVKVGVDGGKVERFVR